jgi:AAA domain
MKMVGPITQEEVERELREEAYRGLAPALVKTRPRPSFYTAGDLRHMEFEPLSFVIPGYLIEGLTLLVGKPKLGKSWMALDWLLAVAHGGHAFGTIKVDERDCLYMALEDSPRRLQRRIDQLLPSADQWSPRLTLCHHMERLDQGGLEEIRAWAASVPLPSLVVVDTFAKVRPGKLGGELPYDADYRHMGLLQELATDLGISVVVVHHQRKMEATDPLDTASGSTGLTGAADSILVLNRDGQGITLYGRGRDLDDIEVAMSFDKVTAQWTVLGAANEVRRSETRNLVLDALAKSTEPLSPSNIGILTGLTPKQVEHQLHRMMRSGDVVSPARGRYAYGGGGGIGGTGGILQ